MTKSKWRMLLSMFALFAVLAIAVACGDDDDDEGDGGDGDDATPTTTTQAPSGTITIGATQFETWDPHLSDFAQDITHFVYVWRGLYHLDLNDQPEPAMAEAAPEISDDGKTYTITLKSGLMWSDGDDLKAEDFVWGILRTCNPETGGYYQSMLTNVVGCDEYYASGDASDAEKQTLMEGVGVKAVDDLTLEIQLENEQPTFSTQLALWVAFPVPVHKLDSPSAAWPGPVENVYNGPFMPTAYTEQSEMVLEPNPNWAGTPVGVEKVVLKYVDDPAVLNQAYRAGEVNATVVNKPEIGALRTEFGEEVIEYPSTRTLGLEFNVEEAPFDNPDVRVALSRATDRDTLVDVVFDGANFPTTSWVPPVRNGLEGGDYDDLIGFDEDAPKEALADAGFADGAGLPEITLLLTDTAANKLLGEFLQAEWKRILNIDITLEFVDSQTRSARFNASDFQLVVGGWQEDYPDPENWFLGLWQTDGSYNKTNTSDPELDAIIAAAQYNSNDEERRDQYRQAEEILLSTANGIAPIYHGLAAFLVNTNISGMVENQRPGDTFVPGDWYIELWRIS
jgi:ABC-type oligopeptide transport system substrate-binding subunit